jgi:serine/threonine-protein kinase
VAEPPPNAALDPRLDTVIAEYLESVERGEPSDPAPWLRRHPDLAGELGAFFAAEARFDHLVTPLRSRSPSGSSAGNAATPPVRSVSDYELLSELGRGGMGVIYKARQRSLNRLVALKTIRSGEWATPEERLRFRLEAETVATLDHPNIVPIYEVGELPSADGTRLPFFSMKLIEGENLSQAKGRFRGNWGGIARLMSLVTRAVGHAHQRGVLHRDLKPANVLLRITPGPAPDEEARRGAGFPLGDLFVTPHISDFGLARRAQQQRAGTLPGAILGTPMYLAPELTAGHEAATSASDVYSLGAILYELLTGAPPFQAQTTLEAIRLAAANAVRPPRQANPAIPRDLETICLKCLETEPGKRYPSADELAEDLENFLARRPIAARPVGTLGRLGRWCRRQPVIAGLSAALMLVVLVSFPLILWSWRRAVEQERLAEQRLTETRRERDRADEAFGLAHNAVEDVFRLLAEDRWEDMPGSEPFKRQLLEHGLQYYRTFVERRRDDPKLRREVADAMFQIGLIATRIGPKREAVESYQTAIALLRPLLRESPDDLELRKSLGRALLNLGNALNALNRVDEAIKAHEEVVEVWAGVRKDRPDSEAAKEQAAGWMNRGVALQGKEDWPRALESFRRCHSLLTESGAGPKDPRLMVLCLLNISQAEDRLGRREEASRAAREAAAVAELMLKASPRGEDARLMTAHAARSLGNLHREHGEPEPARTNLELARRTLDELHRQRPRRTDYAWNLAGTCDELAALAESQKKPADAQKALEQAESLLKELVEHDGESHPNRSSLARVERRLARAHERQGNAEGARRAYEQAKAQLEYLLAHDSPISTLRSDLAGACHQLGVAYFNLKKYPESLAAAEEAERHYRFLLDRTPTDGGVRKNLSGVLGNTAIVQRALRHPPEAIRATEERVKLWPENATELYDAATDFARTFDLASRAKEPAPQVRERAAAAAVSALRAAVRAGFADREKIRTEPLFKGARETPVFQSFLKELEQAKRP